MYSLLTFKVPVNDIIPKSKDLAFLSPCMTQPLFKLGYHYYISRTRETLINIIKKIESKKKFYNIVNNFEPDIQDYNDTIQNLTKIYFNIKSDSYSEDFYKMWEILNIFNIVSNDKINVGIMNTNLSDCDKAVSNYIDKILNKESSKLNLSNIEIQSPQKLDSVFKMIKDVSKSKKYMNLIVANSDNNNYTTYLGELLATLNCQDKNGNLVFKMFDAFNMVMVKILYILSSLYEQVYIYKPFTSRPSESEKFIVCKKYKYNPDDKNIKSLVSDIEKIIEMSEGNKFLNDIFLDIEVPTDFINTIKFINIKLVNIEQIQVNEIIKYIQENNYFGDKYHTFKNNQVEASKWWIETFYPPTANIAKTNKETIEKLFNSYIDKNNVEKEKFVSNLI
jgi:23S rRNA U2552 (ribose-2'-O)-methylase RlmE/FtsJ